jgi:tagaturonate reductase
MLLSKNNISNIKTSAKLTLPPVALFDLPERVLQFGTGVLLRGLPDFFIDKANRQGIFNGRIVVVKSTNRGGTDEFASQDNLYSICVRGLEGKEKIEEFIVNASISRVLSAQDEWTSILDCAKNPLMQVVVSNTTEVGITLLREDIHLSPPHSFPGKLLAFLFARYKAFNGKQGSGMVIIPTELITNNGSKLREIIFELARHNNLEESFLHWLEEENHFCNSLVDRIVPGKLSPADQRETSSVLGYQDDLMIMTENFRLWAIESGAPVVKEILSFAQADDGVVIAGDIEKFRELKLRLLNGTHSFSCGLAFLAGFKTVREAMENRPMAGFVHNLAVSEIAAAISNGNISYSEACAFAEKVIDRFKNPFIDHQWSSIATQYAAKMKMRNIPLIIKYSKQPGGIPVHMALGFAAFLLYMRSTKTGEGNYAGKLNEMPYEIQDDHAAYFSEQWSYGDPGEITDRILQDNEFWSADLSGLEGFRLVVKKYLSEMLQSGVMATLERERVDNLKISNEA